MTRFSPEIIYFSALFFYFLFESYRLILKKTHPFERDLLSKRIVSSTRSATLICIFIIYFTGIISDERWVKLQNIPIGYCLYDIFITFGNTKIYFLEKNIPCIFKNILLIFLISVFSEKYPQETAIAYIVELFTIPLHLIHLSAPRTYSEIERYFAWYFIMARIIPLIYLSVWAIFAENNIFLGSSCLFFLIPNIYKIPFLRKALYLDK